MPLDHREHTPGEGPPLGKEGPLEGDHHGGGSILLALRKIPYVVSKPVPCKGPSVEGLTLSRLRVGMYRDSDAAQFGEVARTLPPAWAGVLFF